MWRAAERLSVTGASVLCVIVQLRQVRVQQGEDKAHHDEENESTFGIPLHRHVKVSPSGVEEGCEASVLRHSIVASCSM